MPKEIVVEFLWHFAEYFLFYTGEGVLYLLSFGRRKPRWDYFAYESGFKFAVLTEFSLYIGIAVWVGIGALTGYLFS